MVSVTMFEAKTRLSELVKQAQKGETVIITSGREKRPVAKLEAIQPAKKKRLGVLYDPNFVMGEGFWEDLPEAELGQWNGEGDEDFG